MSHLDIEEEGWEWLDRRNFSPWLLSGTGRCYVEEQEVDYKDV